jgi:hypothetical protein
LGQFTIRTTPVSSHDAGLVADRLPFDRKTMQRWERAGTVLSGWRDECCAAMWIRELVGLLLAPFKARACSRQALLVRLSQYLNILTIP